MKKCFKKFLASMLAVLVFCSFIALGAGAAISHTYENGVLTTIKISNTTDPAYHVTSSESLTWKNRANINGTYAMYRIPLPAIAADQEIGEFKFTYTIWGTYCSTSIYTTKLYNLPGTWDMDSLTSSDAEFSAAVADSSNMVAESSITASVNTEYKELTGTNTLTATADITDFAKKAYKNRESYIYMAVTATNSTSAYSTSVYTADIPYRVQPEYSFTLAEIGSSPKYANGVETTLRLNHSTDPSYMVDSSSSTTWQGQKTISGQYAVYSIPLPEISVKQKIEDFKFIFTVVGIDAAITVYNLPGTWDLPSLRTGDQFFAAAVADSANVLSFESQAHATYTNGHTVTVDITEAAKAARTEGYDRVYVAATSQYARNVESTLGWSSEASHAIYPKYSFTLAAVDALTLSSATPSDGATAVPTDSDVKFSFSNPILSAEAYVNGVLADCVISGGDVTVATTLSEYTNYTVSVDVLDKYYQSASESIAFSTLAAVNVSNQRNGAMYSISASADPVLYGIDNKYIKYNTFGTF